MTPPLPAMPPPARPTPLVTATPAAAPKAATASSAGTPATPADAKLPPAVSLGDIGATGPALLLASSASGAWVALCDGEPKTEKLVLGSGSGEAIDDLLAEDPTGRYVVSAHDGVAQLIDAVSQSRVNLSELGADLRRLRADYAEHRALSFDAGGKHLAYLRRLAGGSQIVVRRLDTGSEQVFSPGAGEVFRLQLSPDARWVTLDLLREDTNKNGKLDWPAPEEPPRKSRCEKPGLPKFRSFQYQARGDAVTRAVLSLGDGAVRDVPDLITPLGASLLVREADGGLRLDVGGKRTALSPASCAARVLFADAERGLVLAACAPPPPKNPRKGAAAAPTGKREVWLFGPGYAKNLQSELYETSTDREAAIGSRLVPLYPGSEASLVDLEQRVVLPLPSGSRVVTTSGPLALIWRGSDLYRYDANSKSEQHLAHGILKNPDLLQAGSSVLLSPFVVVGVGGPAFPSPPRALAMSEGGFVLTASPNSAQPAAAGAAESAIQGPLHWLNASLGTPDGPPR